MRRSILLGVMLAIAGTAHATEDVITKVTARAVGSETIIVVHGSATPSFTAYRLQNPTRVLVDLGNGRLGADPLRRGPIEVDSWAVGQIALAEYADESSRTARVMIGLKRPASYDIKPEGHDLVITVTPNEPMPAEATPAQAAKPGVKPTRTAAAQARAATPATAPAREPTRTAAAQARAATPVTAPARKPGTKPTPTVAAVPPAASQEERRRAVDQEVAVVAAQLGHLGERGRAAPRATAKSPRAERFGHELDVARAELARLGSEARRKLALVPTPAGVAAHRAPAMLAEVRDVRLVDGPTATQVVIEVSGAPAASVVQADSRTAVLRIAPARLPQKLARTLDASAWTGPIRSVSTYAESGDPGAVRVEVALTEAGPAPRLSKKGQELTWEFSRAGARSLPPTQVAAYGATLPLKVAASESRPQRRVYSGKRMDLEFNNGDIHNVLRLLAEVGRVNLVIGDDVKGTVTMSLKDVPWDQALDIILRSKGLGMVREGNVVRVAPQAALEKELEAEVARQKAAVELKPVSTRLIGLSYADGAQILPRVNELLSPRGRASIDQRTNTLIITDVANNIALAEDLVRNLDTQTPQVLIEARIVEARTTFLRDIGIQWGGNSINSAATGNPTGIAFPSTVGVAGGATDNLANTRGLQGGAAASPNYAVNMPAAVGTGSGGALGLTLGSLNGNVNIDLRLSALENTGNVRIISAPRITTLDNIQASIEQGVAIPISQVSAAGVNTVFVNANLNLTVKPHVTNEGSIIMNTHITRNEPDFVNVGARGDPTILKKEAQTEMLVHDGDTAVIGGIYTRNTGLSYTKVPWMAEIPVIGWLFKNRRENDDRTELLIFITPRIIKRPTAAR